MYDTSEFPQGDDPSHDVKMFYAILSTVELYHMHSENQGGSTAWISFSKFSGLGQRYKQPLMDLAWDHLKPTLNSYLLALREPHMDVPTPSPLSLYPYMSGKTPNILSVLHLIAQSITSSHVCSTCFAAEFSPKSPKGILNRS